MASTPEDAKADAAAAADAKTKLVNDADALYKLAADAQTSFVDDNGKRSKTFDQAELVELGGYASAKELMPLVSYLARENLFRTVKIAGKLAWNVRAREQARHIAQLDRDEKAVYVIVEESHDRGIWLKDIKRKAAPGVGAQAVQKAVSKMEKAGLVKSVKSVRNPAQKTYMLAHLVPSEDVIGNSFFDAGDLDESFRDELLNLIVFFVRGQSWGDGGQRRREKGKKAERGGLAITVEDDEGGSGKKRKRAMGDIEDVDGYAKGVAAPFNPEDFRQQIHRAGTHTYLTAEDIHGLLTSSSAIKPTKANSLTVPEIQGCIDVLCWDEKLEKVRNPEGTWGYRTVRGVTFKPPGSSYEEFEEFEGTALTQAPCGRCPVFDLCHEEGPVNPTHCVYFDQWLSV